ncbi:MAG TPA: AGE family epimerase/isomerase [Chryseosolibacter sp.]
MKFRKTPARSRWPAVAIAILAYSSCAENAGNGRYMQPEYWKQQALQDILPPWTKYARDSVAGSLFSTLDANWKPEGDGAKFPAMIARHLFSYSAAYLMSGEERYFVMARDIKTYLLSSAWDRKNGGWFNSLSASSDVRDDGKSAFVQVYVTTGLTMYYFVTHDPAVLRYIDESNGLLENHLWDHSSGGYYDEAENDWTLKNSNKSLGSQLAPVSGYLAYLYLATRDRKYLEQAVRITDSILRHMRDDKTGWVLESFDKDWNYVQPARGREEINVGHNLEAAWMLLRLHLLNNRPDYRLAASALSDSIHRYGFESQHGVWFAGIGNDHPQDHSDYTYWWIQAYGNMVDLCFAGEFPHGDHVRNFLKGAAFWSDHFLDRQKGDTHFSVFVDGTVKDYRKANQFKSSYHSMEHSMLNFFYLGCRIDPQPFTLHFRITSREGHVLHPIPIEIADMTIHEVRIGGQVVPSAHDRFVILPNLEDEEVDIAFLPAGAQ